MVTKLLDPGPPDPPTPAPQPAITPFEFSFAQDLEPVSLRDATSQSLPDSLQGYIFSLPGQVQKGMKHLLQGLAGFGNIMIQGSKEWIDDPVETAQLLFSPAAKDVTRSMGVMLVDDYAERYKDGFLYAFWKDPIATTLDATLVFDVAGIGVKSVGASANLVRGVSNSGRTGRIARGTATVGDRLIQTGGFIGRMPWMAARELTKTPFRAAGRTGFGRRLGAWLGTSRDARIMDQGLARSLQEGMKVGMDKLEQAARLKIPKDRWTVFDEVTRGIRPLDDLATDSERAFADLWWREVRMNQNLHTQRGTFSKETMLQETYGPAFFELADLRAHVRARTGIDVNTVDEFKALSLDETESLAAAAEEFASATGRRFMYKPLTFQAKMSFSKWLDNLADTLVLSERGKGSVLIKGEEGAGRGIRGKPSSFRRRTTELLDETVRDPHAVFGNYVLQMEKFKSLEANLPRLALEAGARVWKKGVEIGRHERVVPLNIYRAAFRVQADLMEEVGGRLSRAAEVVTANAMRDKDAVLRILSGSFELEPELLATMARRIKAGVKDPQFVVMPEGAALALERWAAPRSGLLERTLRTVNDWWKPMMLGYSLRYATGNLLGNVILALAGGGTPGGYIMRSSAAIRKAIPPSLYSATVPSEISAAIRPALKGAMAAAAKPFVAIRNLGARLTQAINFQDQIHRQALFLTEVFRKAQMRNWRNVSGSMLSSQKKVEKVTLDVLTSAKRARQMRNQNAARTLAGRPEARISDELLQAEKIVEDAIREAERFFFNYQTSLTHFERKWFREVVPFWTFMSNMTKLMAQAPFIRPKTMAAFDRLADWSVDMYDALEKPEILRDYIPIGVDAETGVQLWGYVSSINPMGSALTGDTEFVSSLHPLITTTISTVSGRDTWTLQNIDLNSVVMWNGRVYEYDHVKRRIRIKPPLGFNHIPTFFRQLLNQAPKYRLVSAIIDRYVEDQDRDAEPTENPVGVPLNHWATSILRFFNVNAVPQDTLESIERYERVQKFQVLRAMQRKSKQLLRSRDYDTRQEGYWWLQRVRGLASGKDDFKTRD